MISEDVSGVYRRLASNERRSSEYYRMVGGGGGGGLEFIVAQSKCYNQFVKM